MRLNENFEPVDLGPNLKIVFDSAGKLATSDPAEAGPDLLIEKAAVDSAPYESEEDDENQEDETMSVSTPIVMPPRSGSQDNRHTLLLPGNGISMRQSIEAFYSHVAPTQQLFCRGGAVVTLHRDDKGEPKIEIVDSSGARSLFEKFVKVAAYRSGRNGKKVISHAVFSADSAKAFLASDIAKSALPKITGVCKTPFYTELADGSLHLIGNGYCPKTGMLITGDTAPEDVPPSDAVKAIVDLFAEFDFQTPADRSRAIANAITPALKMGGLIRGAVPIDTAEADRSQAGKSFRHRLVAGLYGEKLNFVPLRKGGVGSSDESLSERLIQGRPFVSYDNYRGRLDSPLLESLVTADGPFPCRVVNSREVLIDPSRFFIQLSSNGVELTKDLGNRCCIVRIRKRDGFRYKDVLGDIEARPNFYVGCMLSIVRHWHEAGKPRTGDLRHTFTDWAQTVDWIVQNFFKLPSPLDGLASAVEAVASPSQVFIRAVGLAIEQAGRLHEALTSKDLVHIAYENEIPIPGTRNGAGNEKQDILLVGTKVGSLFRKADTIEVERLRVRRSVATVYPPAGSGSGPFTQKEYRFSRVDAPTETGFVSPTETNAKEAAEEFTGEETGED